MLRDFGILIVDDNPADFNLIFRKITKGLEADHLREVMHALDGDSCIEMLSSEAVHCVVLDYRLGIESGLDVLKRIRNIRQHIPIIMLTGEGDENIAVQAMKQGASDYLVKSEVDPESLAYAIRKAMERQILRKRLRDKQRELEEFVYTAAHDIKAPLAIINQTAQLLKIAPNDENQVVEHAGTLLEMSDSLIDLVNNLLNYAKAGRMEKELGDVELDEVVASVRRNLAAAIAAKNATIEVEEKLPIVKGDPVALLQLFQNLILNGIKFSRKGVDPIIKIYTGPLRRDDVEFDYRICIEDNGRGISESDLNRIFSPLVRLANDSEDHVEGHGLGLAIVRKVAEQHHAKLTVTSNVGQGTIFSLLLKADPPV